MTTRRHLSIAGIFVFLQLFSINRSSGAVSPDTCINPIQITSIIITNSVCGDSSGVILLSLNDLNAGYTFQWSPNVSNTNIAFGLKAAAYHIHIERTNDPACSLDTTVVVNNSNGPAAQVAEVLPSHCFASDGKVTLTPANFNYSWSN